MMTTTLLGRLTDAITPELVGGLAQQLGQPEPAISRGLSALLPGMLGATAARAEDPAFVARLYDLVTDSDNDPGLLEDPARMLDDDKPTPIKTLGGRMVGSVFGNRVDETLGKVAAYSGLPPFAVSSMVEIAAPIVLSTLRQKAEEDDLAAGELGKLLREERSAYEAAMPAGLGGFDDMLEARQDSPAASLAEPDQGGSFWRWVVPLLIAALIAWFVLQLTNEGSAEPPADGQQSTMTEQ